MSMLENAFKPTCTAITTPHNTATVAMPNTPSGAARLHAVVEHPAAHDHGAATAHVLLEQLGLLVVLAAVQAVLAPPGRGRNDPLVDTFAAVAEPVPGTVIGPGDEAVERHRDLCEDGAHHALAGVWARKAPSASSRSRVPVSRSCGSSKSSR